MWLFLWILFVLSIIGIFVWSFYVGHEQKRAWQAFANKYHLQFAKGAMFQPPVITGQLKDRLVNIYTQQNPDNGRGKKTSTMIEVFLNRVPMSLAYVSSHGFNDLAEQLQLPEPFSVSDPDWPMTNIIARAPDAVAASIWFSAHKNRARAVNKLVKMPYDTAFLIDDDRAFLVLRTTDPLSDPRIMNKLIIELYEIASLLETDAAQAPVNQDNTETTMTDQQVEIENPNDPNLSPLPSTDEPKE